MPNSKKKILVVDDDVDYLFQQRVQLESAGFEVRTAETQADGEKMLAEEKPDLVIVDLMMENVDSGSTVAQKLKESGYKGPVYMLSSAGDTVRYNLDARELGLAGIFQKPIDPKTLVATLKAKLKV